jgi:outer membrane protein assembly factor BamB
MRFRCAFRAVAITGLFAAVAAAADWPQWRGPLRDGISKETGLLKEWPKDGPKLLWQVKDIGSGYSTPAVVGEHLYVLGNTGMDDEFVEALSIVNGKKDWSTRIGKVGPNGGQQYSGARSTPTVDGASLYALGSDGDLVCLETATGKLIWRKSLRIDFGGRPGLWAFAESPLIDGDVLVCTPGGKEATLVALDKKSGEVIWKSATPEGDRASYSSIIATEINGVKQYVQFVSMGVVGVDAKTGRFLWRYNQTAKGSLANIPTPVAHDGYIFTGTGAGTAGLIKLKGSGSTFETDPVYIAKDLPRGIGGAVRIGAYLYGTDSKGLLCAEFATGKIKWHEKSVGPGALCFVDCMLYVRGESGEVALVEATPQGYRETGRFTPPGQPKRGRTKAWPYPVVANGRLYLRDLEQLWCYDVRDNKSAP